MEVWALLAADRGCESSDGSDAMLKRRGGRVGCVAGGVSQGPSKRTEMHDDALFQHAVC